MGPVQRPALGGEPHRAITGAVIGQLAADTHPPGAEPGQRPADKGAGGLALFVGQHLDVRHPGAIIDGDVDDLPPGAMALSPALSVARCPRPEIRPSFLVSRCSMSPTAGLIALDEGRGLEPPPSVQPASAQDPRGGRRADPQGGGDLGARPVVPAQHFGGELQAGRRHCWTHMRAAGPVRQARRPIKLIPGAPFPGGARRTSSRRAIRLTAPRPPRAHEFLSTPPRQSGILVDVHPGLLSRVSNDLAATTFPRSAWVNNLLTLHS